LFFSITQYPYFWVSGKQGAVQSLKYECVYLNAFETGSEMRAGIGKWLTYYNSERPQSTHGILTPDEAYDSKTEPMRIAA
jgi:putative transposase